MKMGSWYSIHGVPLRLGLMGDSYAPSYHTRGIFGKNALQGETGTKKARLESFSKHAFWSTFGQLSPKSFSVFPSASVSFPHSPI
jgi:hypothetical protein